jgi:hypothetical protein
MRKRSASFACQRWRTPCLAAWRGLFEVQMARASTGHIDLKPFLNTIKYSAIFKA